MKLGLMGLKGHHSDVLAGLALLPDWELAAVSDDDARVLADFRATEPRAAGAETYADWRHLIEHSPLDACCLFDTNLVRPEQIVALAKRGVPMLCEKPLATTLSDLALVGDVLADTSCPLSMMLTMRHEPQYALVRRLVSEGAIGHVCQASAQKSYRVGDRPAWQKSRRQLGGTIPFIGIHALDLLRWTCGLECTEVAAFHGNLSTPEFGETEDHASVLLRFSTGASATTRLDYLRPEPAPTHGDDRLRIAGSSGVIETSGLDPVVYVITDDQPPQRFDPPAVDNIFVAFAKALAAKEAPPISTEDCLAVTKLVLHARDAADKGVLVEIPAGRGATGVSR